MKINNVLIIKGLASQYGVLNDFSNAIADELKNLSVNVTTFDFNLDTNDPNNLLALNQSYDLVFSFNAILLDTLDSIINNPNTLIWSFLVDHPYHLHARLLKKCNNHIVSCVDKNHVSYVKTYYPNIENVFFVPHGGDGVFEAHKPFDQREYNVCLMGTYKNTDSLINKLSALPEPDKSIATAIVNHLTQGSKLTIEQLLYLELSKRNINIPKSAFANLLSALLFIDVSIRANNRKLILDKLTSEGITVDVFGNGWEGYKCEHPEHLRIHQNVPYQEALSIMSNAKIVLNPLPLFRNGSHERVFSSMFCGALCLSEINTYLSEQFTHGEDIVFFDMNDLESLVTNIKLLLSNQELSQKICQNGYKKASDNHLWKHRAKEILDIANSVYEKQLYASESITITNNTDLEFNHIINYIKFNSAKLLTDKMKAIFSYYEMVNPTYADAILRKLTENKLWPIEDFEGDIYCSNVINDLKEHIDDYISLYNTYSDITSKKALVRMIENKLCFSFDDLRNTTSPL